MMKSKVRFWSINAFTALIVFLITLVYLTQGMSVILIMVAAIMALVCYRMFRLNKDLDLLELERLADLEKDLEKDVCLLSVSPSGVITDKQRFIEFLLLEVSNLEKMIGATVDHNERENLTKRLSAIKEQLNGY